MSANLKIPAEFDSVSTDEQIAFVQELWERIARDPERIGVPDEHQRILEERLDAYVAQPQPGKPWSEVRDELLARLRDR